MTRAAFGRMRPSQRERYLLAARAERRSLLDCQCVACRSIRQRMLAETSQLKRELAEVEREESRLLDPCVDDAEPIEAVRERLAALGRQKAGLRERMAKAEAR